MGANPLPTPITVAEWARVPDPPGGWYELHHGELVFVTRPVRKHWDLQRRLQKLLEPACEDAGYLVGTEYAYRPFRDYEVWTADVAVIRKDRHEAVDEWLLGSPELVIEVKSPSNSHREMLDKAMTTLAGEGAVEFWIVDPESRTITVHSRLAEMRVYGGGQVLCPAITGRVLGTPADLFGTL